MVAYSDEVVKKPEILDKLGIVHSETFLEVCKKRDKFAVLRLGRSNGKHRYAQDWLLRVGVCGVFEARDESPDFKVIRS